MNSALVWTYPTLVDEADPIMRAHSLAAILLILTGCTSDWDSTRATSIAASGRPNAAERASALGASSAGMAAPRAFASLPDRGSLIAYEQGRKPRSSGAYKAYPVLLSEEHALKAAHAGGQLSIPSPDGGTIRLAYERHVEHPDGNWTWIGRNADGTSAVLTFGEKAVFGSVSIPGDEPLRLTTSMGGAWLVAGDRNRLPKRDPGVRRGGESDYFVPPKMAASNALSASLAPPVRHLTAAAAPVSAAAAAAAATTIDVAIGYTNGYAAALGGTSQAITRLNNLIEVTNQAYANSGINAQVKLVTTVAVNFQDDTDNGNALEKLSGYTNNGPTTPDPAFAGLRAAREAYGADLVALVRDFRTPQNNGCGIAWLIGSGGEPVTQEDAPFGYSVVSDGSDVDEGDGSTYFCRDESLAHEMGHNMGQAHNREDSTSAGAHPYSYGYRESTTNGFYTVMAYRLGNSSQTAIRYFANPSIQFSGRPTGVAGSADNALSMNQTMPIIAAFRASVGPVSKASKDVDGDGKSDVLWYQPTSRILAYWIMNGASVGRSYGQNLPAGYTLIANGDYDADGHADVVIKGQNGEMTLWRGDGNAFSASTISSGYPNSWNILGSPDVDGDGKSDLLWYQATSRTLAYWIMNASNVVRSSGQPLPAGYAVVANGDYYGDGRADVLLQGPYGDLHMWNGNGSNFGGPHVSDYPASWLIIGSPDVDGDGKSDVLWYQPSSRTLAYWIMSGANVVRAYGQPLPSGYTVVAIGDYYGDGRADVLLRGPYGDLHMWNGNGSTFGGPHVSDYPVSWEALP
ncbi:hypothetical protein FCE95_16550 [Luteimonas gilva]|uniref:Peptidase M12B domain-containing protein n=1 Tax=Luteimonas gilva TaxID=2572684 RepID=A0A4U5JN40_9GAMM|nr:FG-GAP-like repeat-containing protein [Luteimonas gilva]TKR29728.1 hypothetical protein FCE95_16550 [Luteimonas gilva]